MFCPACGTENLVGARVCVDCAAGLDFRCSRCAGHLPAGARFCPACGGLVQSADPRQLPEAPGPTSFGERRQVTVLFADFAGFTAWAHREDVEDVRDFMDAAWNRIDSIILAHGGLIEKHIGDAIMAVFGARQAREDDPVQAVRAALAIQTSVGSWASQGSLPLQMRVGVHTGAVVTGRLGHTGEFAITGDAVNLASRIEQAAPVAGVLISHETYRQVYGFFDLRAMPLISVKGKPDPIQTYLVTAAKPRAVAAQLRGVEGVPAEMIGRQAELRSLQTAFESVLRERRCRVVTVLGEAGIGKSCLLREFQNWVELLPDEVRFFSGRATPEMLNLPFSLIRDVFFARFEIQESDPPAVAREKLERGLTALLQGNSSKDQDFGTLAHAHYIGQLLGLDYSSSSSLRNILKDTDQIRYGAFHYFSQFFAAASASQVKAALLVAEDIHWSDDGSLDLIEHLARACGNAPLLIICLARPNLRERRPDWCEEVSARDLVELRAFSPEESDILVRKILRKTSRIPEQLSRLIAGSAEGIPLFIEEIVKMLIDQRVIVPSSGEWEIELDRLAAARMPSSLTGILQARLDGLLPMERAVLQRASVVGRVFWDAALLALGPLRENADPDSGCFSEGQVKTALAGLRQKELILRSQASAFSGAVEYSFKHELLRSVTYENLLRKARREYHAQVAGWLTNAGGGRIGEFAGLVAGHYELAGCHAEAAEWFGRAGQQARLSYAPAAAIDYYRKALSPPPVAPKFKHEDNQRRLDCLGGPGGRPWRPGPFLRGHRSRHRTVAAFREPRRLDHPGPRLEQPRLSSGAPWPKPRLD